MSSSGHLPRLDVFVFLVFVIVLAIFVLVFILVILVVVAVVFVRIVCEMNEQHGLALAHQEGTSVGALGLATGGGYVDQKWRPHLGQTQN
jgi:hypothetical protein